jgi:hypothetical protein
VIKLLQNNLQCSSNELGGYGLGGRADSDERSLGERLLTEPEPYMGPQAPILLVQITHGFHLDAFGGCISQLSRTVTKYLRKST